LSALRRRRHAEEVAEVGVAEEVRMHQPLEDKAVANPQQADREHLLPLHVEAAEVREVQRHLRTARRGMPNP
jgi:hypothetical protein